MLYQEFHPDPALQAYIHRYIVVKEAGSFTSAKSEQFPPYPGRALVFHYHQPRPILFSRAHVHQELPQGYLMPACASDFSWHYAGPFGMFIILFLPGCFRSFYPEIPAEHPARRLLSFRALDLPDLQQLLDHFRKAASRHERVRLADQCFKECLSNIHPHRDLLDTAIQHLYFNFKRNLKDLPAELGISSRHLRRLFKLELGHTPKIFQKTLRFNYLFRKLECGQFDSLPDLADRCGYYDQSHFISEFRHFAGLPPTQFMKNQNSLVKAIYWRDEQLGAALDRFD